MYAYVCACVRACVSMGARGHARVWVVGFGAGVLCVHACVHCVYTCVLVCVCALCACECVHTFINIKKGLIRISSAPSQDAGSRSC